MPTLKGSDNVFPKLLLEKHVDPTTPAAGQVAFWYDTDDALKIIDEMGTVTPVGGGSSDLDAIITASSGQDIADALAGAAAPDAGNVFATMADVGGGGVVGTKMYLGGLPSGTLSRGYTFTSTTESWTTTAGTLSSTGARLRLTHTSPAVAIEPSGASNIADGELDCFFDTTAITGSAAILWRVTDASNFYALIFEPGAGPTFYKCVAGGFSVIAAFVSTFPRMSVIAPMRVLVRFNGTLNEIYINGTLMMMARDTAFSTGRVGVRADNATLEIDTINLYSSPVLTGNVVVA